MSTPEDHRSTPQDTPAGSEGAPASDDAVFASMDDETMVTDSGAAEDDPLAEDESLPEDPLDQVDDSVTEEMRNRVTDSGAAAAEPTDEAADGVHSAVEEPEAEPEPEDLNADASAAAPGVDWHDRYLREAAELDNVRKRARRDVAAAEARGIGRLAKELLPALDDLDRALASAETQEADDEHHLTRGIRLVQQQLLQSLQRIGIQADSPKGEKFDPHRHEALAQQPAPEGTEKGVVLDVYQPGYVYADTVLRAAKVIVAN